MKVEKITKILNEKYDKRTINNPSVYGLAVKNISEETSLLPSIIELAIDMWVNDLI